VREDAQIGQDSEGMQNQLTRERIVTRLKDRSPICKVRGISAAETEH